MIRVSGRLRHGAESVYDTRSVTLVQAGLIQQVFEQVELRFGRGGGVLMALGKGEA